MKKEIKLHCKVIIVLILIKIWFRGTRQFLFLKQIQIFSLILLHNIYLCIYRHPNLCRACYRQHAQLAYLDISILFSMVFAFLLEDYTVGCNVVVSFFIHCIVYARDPHSVYSSDS